jgi:predicted lipoprotein with Yx(FWY)xxD motif
MKDAGAALIRSDARARPFGGSTKTATDWGDNMTYHNALALAAMAAAVLAVGAARADEDYGPLQVIEAAGGKVLADPKGMTLYTFDKDADGKSACNGPCATNWPPLKASAGAKTTDSYTVIKRDDGAMQWAYKGKPLYTWKDDKKAGDITGDGVNKVWHIAKP